MLQQVIKRGVRVPVTPLARHASGGNRDWRHKTAVPPYAGWDETIDTQFKSRAANPSQHTSPMGNNRSGIADSVLDLVGQTPLVRMSRLRKHLNIDPSIDLCAKLEYFNAGGSVKDRVGLRMIQEAEKDGRIKPGDVIIEPTSGNTGIGLCLAGALSGYKVLITMPQKMSGEKLNTMKALGAEILRTPTEAAWDDESSHISLAAELAETSPDAHVLDQYLNAGNPLSHFDGTATEILQQTNGQVDVVIVGAGTGGTVTGISKKIKEGAPHCKIVAVDPVGSILAVPDELNDYKRLEGYEVEGIGYDFIPTVLDRGVVDEWVKCGDQEGFDMARKMIQLEGMMVGGSSGYAMGGAYQYIKANEEALKGKRVVIVCPDSIRNYMSKFLDDAWMEKHGFKQTLPKGELPSAPLKKVAYEKRMLELEEAKKSNKISQENYEAEKVAIETRLGPSK